MAVRITLQKCNSIFKNIVQPSLTLVKNYSKDSPLFRQNFSPRTEQQLNVQISQELLASHSYLAMANFFSRTDISLHGSAGYFLAMSNEERDHALQLINYQNMRGGRVTLHGILKPKEEFPSLFMALEHAMLLERSNTQALMELVDVAEKEYDVVTADFIVSKFLNEQMESLRSIGAMLARLNKFQHSGFGEYMIDLELQKNYPLIKDEVSKNLK